MNTIKHITKIKVTILPPLVSDLVPGDWFLKGVNVYVKTPDYDGDSERTWAMELIDGHKVSFGLKDQMYPISEVNITYALEEEK